MQLRPQDSGAKVRDRENQPRLRYGEAAVDADAAADAREQSGMQALADDVPILEDREAKREAKRRLRERVCRGDTNIIKI